jgi:hypothetical protein
METILELSPIDWVILVLAIAAYAPLVLGITRQEDKSQTAFTWTLYLILDCITMFTCKMEKGAYIMLFGFAIGSLVMAVILLYQRRFGWTLLETITIILIVICVSFWQISGSYWAIRFSIAAESIVGIYLIIKTFKNPVVEYNFMGYVSFLIVSVLALFAAKNFSIPQIGFPFCETVLNVIILVPLIRKWYLDKILEQVVA